VQRIVEQGGPGREENSSLVTQKGSLHLNPVRQVKGGENERFITHGGGGEFVMHIDLISKTAVFDPP